MKDSNIPKVRSVLVDVAVCDRNGAPISDEMLSSGGARRPDGSLITQYSNPRIPEPALTEAVVAERKFDEALQRQSQARRRREEELAQATRERRLNEVRTGVNSFLEQVVYPTVKLWWRTRGPEDVKRAGRWIVAPLRREKAIEDLLQKEDPTTASPQSSDEDGARAADLLDGSPAEVIQIDKYRDRRSA